MAQPQSPLHPLLDEINKAAVNGLPFLAVAMTVALPDICVSLASVNGLSTGQLYKEWCKDNLGSEFSFVTGDDLWSMRCGVLHNGRFGDLRYSVNKIVFAIPGGPVTFKNCKINDAYIYSVVDFCKNLTDAVSRWYEKHKDDATVKANLPRLMQYRFGGLAPYIVGTTVLA